ncbi:MAG: choice-of-anchor L domain-containing protein, partial [Lentimicrobiaceae bacterium]|nr:choice-of-anchor L domain-containing protein [Lentimicrobiaceae bacterium]
MKKVYPFLILFFATMLFLQHDNAFSQDLPPRTPPPQQRSINPTPAAGSIWVNRNIDLINGRPCTDLSPEELVRDVLLGQAGGGCATGGQISNVNFFNYNKASTTWNHTPDQRTLSYFSHGTIGSGLEMVSGLLLTTGDCRDVEGPNSYPSGVPSTVPYESLTSDPNLTQLPNGHNLTNGAKLEFDFVPLQSEISFDYIFASEEYEYPYYQTYYDVFGFFISELDAGGNVIASTTRNIAKLPNGQEVSIATVNPTTNIQYYVANTGVYMEFLGRTIVLTAKANVIPGIKYRLKLAVANFSDNAYGTGVFLRAGSLDLGAGVKNFGEGGLEINTLFEGCETNALEINFLPSQLATTSVTLAYSGTAANDIRQLNNAPMPTSLTAPPLSTSVTIPYKVASPVTANGGNIRIIASTSQGGCEQIDTINLVVYSAIIPEVTTIPSCEEGEGGIAVSVSGGSPKARMSLDEGLNWQLVGQSFSGLSQGDYELWITDSISCDTLFIPVTIDALPELLQPNPAGANIAYNTTHTFSLGAATTSAGTITYLWQQSTDSLTWSAASGANNTQNYTTPALTSDMYYRRIAISNLCDVSINSKAALVSVSCYITLIASPSAYGTVSGGGEFNYEDPVTISAIPNEGYEFVKWTINTATGPLFTTSTDTSFLATQSLTLVANFVVKKYPIVLL